MVSAGSDGTVKIWNFSNGSTLKNLLGPPDKENPSGRPRVDKEVTQLVCVSYPIEEG
jgi:WD40 repeat protein